MRKFTILGLAVLASAVLMAAIPQDTSPARSPLKYGDRCLTLVGKEFYVGPEGTNAHQGANGPYKLVSVGVDFVEFESESDRVLIPLASLRITAEKRDAGK